MPTSHGQRQRSGPVLPASMPPRVITSPSRSSASAAASPAGRTIRRRSGGCSKAAWTRSRRSRPIAGTVRAFHDPDPSRPGKTYSRWGGFVEGIDRFDPHFFGISPREAARMDPQQRLLLEVAWEGLEDAGLPLDRIAGSRTAVFVGISSFDYSVLETSFRDRGEIDVYSNTGGSLSIAANRISYSFDLRGPSAAVDTACSSALVAVHLACRSIWQDGCPMAMAGGVNALLLPDWYVGFCRMGMLSPEGRCRAFDAGAGGFVRSEGAGMVVLKPLSRALADGDRVYAVIRGTAMNQDGRTPGMTMPGQAGAGGPAAPGVPRRGRRRRRRSGTSRPTAPARSSATRSRPGRLGRVLSEGRPADRPCLIGSVKTNIGHLEAGAGHRRADQGRAGAAPSPHPRQPAFRSAQPGDRLRRAAPPGADALRAVAGRRRPAPGRGQLLRIRRHQCARRPARGAGCGDRSRLACPPRARCGQELRARAWLVPLSARGPEALRASARSWEEFARDRARTTSRSRRSPPAPRSAAPITITAWRSWPARSRSWRSGCGSSPRAGRPRASSKGERRPTAGRGWRSSARGRGRSGGRWAGNCSATSRSSAP